MPNKQQNFNEQMKRFAEMQTRSFEPLRIFGGLAADTMEQVVRKNYAVMGDLVEFSVKQAHLPLSGDNAGDVMAAQIADASALTELMSTRAAEYVELAGSVTTRMRQASDDAAASVR